MGVSGLSGLCRCGRVGRRHLADLFHPAILLFRCHSCVMREFWDRRLGREPKDRPVRRPKRPLPGVQNIQPRWVTPEFTPPLGSSNSGDFQGVCGIESPLRLGVSAV